jgi:hypothetical protein
LLLAAIAVAAVLVAVLVVVVRRPTHAQPPTGSTGVERTAFADAETACRHMRSLESLVRSNGSADAARKHVRLGEAAARDAAQGDARWVALSGAVMALRVAILEDDPQAAAVGIRSVHAECGPFNT